MSSSGGALVASPSVAGGVAGGDEAWLVDVSRLGMRMGAGKFGTAVDGAGGNSTTLLPPIGEPATTTRWTHVQHGCRQNLQMYLYEKKNLCIYTEILFWRVPKGLIDEKSAMVHHQGMDRQQAAG